MHAPLLLLAPRLATGLTARQVSAALLVWWAATAAGCAAYVDVHGQWDREGATTGGRIAWGLAGVILAALAATLGVLHTLLGTPHTMSSGGTSDSNKQAPPLVSKTNRAAWVLAAWAAFGLPQFGMLYLLFPLAQAHAALMVPLLSLASASTVFHSRTASALRLLGLCALPIGLPVWIAAGAPHTSSLSSLLEATTSMLMGAAHADARGGPHLAWLLMSWAPTLALLLASEIAGWW